MAAHERVRGGHHDVHDAVVLLSCRLAQRASSEEEGSTMSRKLFHLALALASVGMVALALAGLAEAQLN